MEPSCGAIRARPMDVALGQEMEMGFRGRCYVTRNVEDICPSPPCLSYALIISFLWEPLALAAQVRFAGCRAQGRRSPSSSVCVTSFPGWETLGSRQGVCLLSQERLPCRGNGSKIAQQPPPQHSSKCPAAAASPAAAGSICSLAGSLVLSLTAGPVARSP